MKAEQSFLEFNPHLAERSVFQFTESLSAFVTAVTLASVAVFAEFDGSDLAVVTSHLALILSAIRPTMTLLGSPA